MRDKISPTGSSEAKSQDHLKTLASFASRPVVPGSLTRLIEIAPLVTAASEAFIAGERSDVIVGELKRVYPIVRDGLLELAHDLDQIRKLIPGDGAVWDLRSIIHYGGYAETVCWNLFPDDPESIKGFAETESAPGEEMLIDALECSVILMKLVAEAQNLWKEAQE